jgi:hypothetical protein
MWKSYSGMILTGNGFILGPSWEVGPQNRFIFEHKVDSMKAKIQAGHEVAENHLGWFEDIDEVTLGGNPCIKSWYEAGRALMVNISSIQVIL